MSLQDKCPKASAIWYRQMERLPQEEASATLDRILSRIQEGITNRDFHSLWQWLRSNSNRVSRKAFEELSGVKLPSAMRDVELTLAHWAGFDLLEYKKNESLKEQALQLQRKQQDLDAEIDRLKRKSNRYQYGDRMASDLTQWIDWLLADGYKPLKYDLGVGYMYRFVNTSGVYYTLKDRLCNLYLKKLGLAPDTK